MEPFEIQGVSEFMPSYDDGDVGGVRESRSDVRIKQFDIILRSLTYM